jgi:hypothetical protein
MIYFIAATQTIVDVNAQNTTHRLSLWKGFHLKYPTLEEVVAFVEG